MSVISSKQPRKHVLVNFVFVFLVLLIALLVLVPFRGHPFGNTPASFSASENVSFTADLQYWNANCSHGWTAEAACKAITARAQSCSINSDSIYCTEYERYLQQYLNQ